jgi:hypothetical protein
MMPARGPMFGGMGGAGAGGGAGASPLVPGTAPANQALSAGTTSSSAISWTDPSGGTSPYTPSTALAHIVGSGASLSGDAVTGLEDGDVVAVTRTWTDADGQIVARTAVVSVAVVPGELAWATKTTLPLDDADIAGPWSSGTNNVTTGGGATTLCTVDVARSGSTNGVVETVANGLKITGVAGTGNINAAVNLDAKLSTDAAWFQSGNVLVQIAVTDFAISSTGYLVLGLSPLATQGAGFVGLILEHSSGSLANVSYYYDATKAATPIASGVSITSFTLDIELFNGRVARVRYNAGATTFDDPGDVTGLSHPGSALQSAASSQVFGAAFHVLASVKHSCSATLSDIRVSRIEAA